MGMPARSLLTGCAALLAAACTRVVGGAGLPAPSAEAGSGIDVDRVLLDQSRMKAITGADDHLTVIPTMDGKSPIDLDALAEMVPAACRFVYAETATFGPEVESFHKTTFQYPPRGALISEGAAGYHDAGAARRALEALVLTVEGCATISDGALFVGDWHADEQSLHTRSGDCGRAYRVKSTVLLEVTFCGFPASVSDIVLANIAANVPG
jgi:hypothetical protein